MLSLPARRRIVTVFVWTLFTCTVIGGSFAACVVVVNAIFGDLCGNFVVDRVPSPDAQLELVVFERDCGATTGFSTQASIVAAGAALENVPGNVLDADTNHGAAPAGPGGGPELRVRWTGTRTLSIAYHERASVYRSWLRQHGVRIEYSTFR